MTEDERKSIAAHNERIKVLEHWMDDNEHVATDVQLLKKCIEVHNGDVTEINRRLTKIEDVVYELRDNFTAIRGGLTLAKWLSGGVGFLLVVLNIIIILVYKI